MNATPFWESFAALFGGKVPGDRLRAWAKVWGSRGYTHEDMVRALGQLARTPADQRPTFPDDYIGWIELAMRRAVVSEALAGRVDPGRLAALVGEIEAEATSWQKQAKEAGAGLPDVETEPLRKYRAVRDLARKARSLAIEAKAPSAKPPTLPNPVLAILHDSTKTAIG